MLEQLPPSIEPTRYEKEERPQKGALRKLMQER